MAVRPFTLALLTGIPVAAAAVVAMAPAPDPAGLRVAVTYGAGLARGPLDGRLLLLLSKDRRPSRGSRSPTTLSRASRSSASTSTAGSRGRKPSSAATSSAIRSRAWPGSRRGPTRSRRSSTGMRPSGAPTGTRSSCRWTAARDSSGARRPGISIPLRARSRSTRPGGRDDRDRAGPGRSRRSPIRRRRSTSGTSGSCRERLSKFWGRPMYLGAHILLPEGFDTHPDARYPLVINHGHFPYTLDGFRPEPPDPNLKPEYSERFRLEGYNRIQQEQAHAFFKDWTGPGYPRYVLVEIQHANPYYDDSYAVNSQNLGPYGDAINLELLPVPREEVPDAQRRLGAFPLRRLDRRLGGAGLADPLPGCVQRLLGRLPRPDRLPPVHGRQHLRGPERVLLGGAVGQGRDARPSELAGPSSGDGRADQPPGARARDEEPLGRAVGHLGGRLLPRRPRRLSAAHLGQAHGRHRQDGGRALEGELRPRPHPAAGLEQGARQEARGQDPHLRRRHGQLLSEQRRLPRRGVPRRARPILTMPARSPTATGPSTAGTATPRGPTPSRGCAITRCSRRRSSSGFRRARRPGRT